MHRLRTRKIFSVVQVLMGVASEGVREKGGGIWGAEKRMEGQVLGFFWYKNVMNETDKEKEAEGYIYTTQTVNVLQKSKWDIKERGWGGGERFFQKNGEKGHFFPKGIICIFKS